VTTVALSVVMPCLNGLPELREQLDSLVRERPPFDWELLLADNGSTDGSARVALEYGDRLPVRVIDASATRGVSAARNVGARCALGRNLWFLDADDVIEPGSLAAMNEGLDEYGFAAARLDVYTLNPSWAVSARYPDHYDGGIVPGRYPSAAGAVIGIRKELFDAVDGFDEDFILGADDIDFCWRVQEATSTPLVLCDGAVVRYRLRPSARSFFRQGRSYGRGEVQLFVKWGTGPLGRSRPGLALRRFLLACSLVPRWWARDEVARGCFLLGLTLGRAQGSVQARALFL